MISESLWEGGTVLLSIRVLSTGSKVSRLRPEVDGDCTALPNECVKGAVAWLSAERSGCSIGVPRSGGSVRRGSCLKCFSFARLVLRPCTFGCISGRTGTPPPTSLRRRLGGRVEAGSG